jgi:phosphate transport system substrate-binding protein
VTSSGSKNSLPALIDKKTQVGMTSAQYTDEQIDALLKLRGLSSRSEVEHVLALDGIMLVVNPSNPIRSLDLCGAAKIFAGKSKYWPDGGLRKPIEVHSTYLSSGTFEVFKDLVMARCNEQLGAGVVFHTAQPDVRAAVEANASAIGFLGKSELSPAVKTLNIGGGCGVEVAPTGFNIKSEDYLLSRRLYLYTPYKVSNNAESFLNFALHDIKAQEALKGESTTDQTVETARQVERLRLSQSLPENTDELFPILRRDVAGAERASISIRFQFGSDKLDTKAQADVPRLVSYLQLIRPRRILLAGCTDDVGSVSRNRLLAENRAEAMKAAIARIDPTLLRIIDVKGYGKILPVTCNDSDLGRYKNRRVEIWLHL